MKSERIVLLVALAAFCALPLACARRPEFVPTEFDMDEFDDIHPAVFTQLELGLGKRHLRSQSHSRSHAHAKSHKAEAHRGKKKGPHVTVVSNTNVLNSSGDDDDDDDNNNSGGPVNGVVGENGAVQPSQSNVISEEGKVTPAAGNPTTPAVKEDNGDEQKAKAADEAKQKEEKAKKQKQEENEKAEAARAEAERVPHAGEIQAAVKSMTLQREWVGCHRRLGGCDTGAGPWGVGRSHGREYFDRIGGGVAQISDCPGEYVVRGVGVARCGDGFFALQLVFTCCRMQVKLV